MKARRVVQTPLAVKARRVVRMPPVMKAHHAGVTPDLVGGRAASKAPCEGEARRGEMAPGQRPQVVVGGPLERGLGNLADWVDFGEAAGPAARRNVARPVIVRKMATKTKRRSRRNPTATWKPERR
jgi:hypothetical protein